MTLVGQRSFDDMSAPLMDVPFCVLDLETTGLSPDSDAITEIGAVRYDRGVEVGRFQTLVNPDAAIPLRITVVTGITQAMVIDAPRIGEALPSLLEFIGEAVIVGHNVRFDMSFLNAASIRMGYGRLPNRSVDTLRLAQRLIRKEVRSFKLSSLAAHLGSPVTPNHRALDDTLATAHVFWTLLERAGSIGVTHLDDLVALPTIKGSRAVGKLVLTESLPRGPGIYIFRDSTGNPIYVGKATNLRSRVRSYFGGDTRRRIDDMLRDLEEVDYRTTVNEFEASVLEIRAIAEHDPQYNRRSREPRSLHWIRLTDERYPRLSIVRTHQGGLLHLGPFRNHHRATSAMHGLWDGSRIRRCISPGRGCQFSQLGVAICPHDDAVSDAEYAAVVQDLVESVTLNPSPVFERIASRIVTLANHQRFEDAQKVKERWTDLSRSIRSQRTWRSLQEAGIICASGEDGTSAVIHSGSLLSVHRSGDMSPFDPFGAPVEALEPRPAPASMCEAEEAELAWKWLTSGQTSLVSVTGTLASQPHGVPRLETLVLDTARGDPTPTDSGD